MAYCREDTVKVRAKVTIIIRLRLKATVRDTVKVRLRHRGRDRVRWLQSARGGKGVGVRFVVGELVVVGVRIRVGNVKGNVKS